jgi:acyl carrier protein
MAQLPKEEITRRVIKVVAANLRVDESEVQPNKAFIVDLGLDSLDIVELVMALETEFHIQIEDDDAEKISTVADAISYIEGHLG